YLGSATGLSTTAVWQYSPALANANFGYRVATAGDVNNDGYADVVITSPLYSNPETNEGAVFVFMGSASGPAATPAWKIESNTVNEYYGRTASSAGDVNGDGYSDLIVGASGYTNGQTNEGAAWVYYGSASGLSTTAAWVHESNLAGAAFGWSVAS